MGKQQTMRRQHPAWALALLGALALSGGVLAQDDFDLPVADPMLVDGWEEPQGTTIDDAWLDERVGPDPDCVTPTPRRSGSARRACSGSKEGPCAVWDPPLSDRCRAAGDRLAEIDIDYTYFGQVDCRSSAREAEVTMIVIHNGDHARNNNVNWQCRKSAAHYTIDRDGAIYQHIGEERAAWHAGRVNQRSIGIELQIQRGYGGTCNSMAGRTLARAAAANGVSEDDIVRELCSPTFEQYDSLNLLLEDIRGRHPIADDGIVGHCEIAPPGGHRDPRAFDWEYIGLSNAAKLASLEGSDRPCDAYHLAQDTLEAELIVDDEWGLEGDDTGRWDEASEAEGDDTEWWGGESEAEEDDTGWWEDESEEGDDTEWWDDEDGLRPR